MVTDDFDLAGLHAIPPGRLSLLLMTILAHQHSGVFVGCDSPAADLGGGPVAFGEQGSQDIFGKGTAPIVVRRLRKPHHGETVRQVAAVFPVLDALVGDAAAEGLQGFAECAGESPQAGFGFGGASQDAVFPHDLGNGSSVR